MNTITKALTAAAVILTLAGGVYFLIPCSIKPAWAGQCCCYTTTGTLCCKNQRGPCFIGPYGCPCAV